MTLVRWDPFRELEEVSDRLNRMFARPAAPRTNGKETMIVADWAPSVDISETDGEYQIKAEIPDVKKEDVKVTLEDGVLTIQGERKHEKEEKGKKFHRIERFYGSFVRTFSLPDVINEERSRPSSKMECSTSICRSRRKRNPRPSKSRWRKVSGNKFS